MLATELPVDAVMLVEPVEEVSLLAKPLVLPVWLRELDELVDGEEVAEVLALLDAWSLLATELPVDGVVLDDDVEEVSLLAKPLVLPV